MKWETALIRFLVFGCGGMLGEVFYGASVSAWNGNWNLHGQSSPWMMIDYGLLGIILWPVAVRLTQWRIVLPARAFVYMLLIYLVEYVSGIIFTWGLGLRVWSYDGVPYNLHGQIMLYSAPIWYALGFCAEFFYRKVNAVAVWMAHASTEGEGARGTGQETQILAGAPDSSAGIHT